MIVALAAHDHLQEPVAVPQLPLINVDGNVGEVMVLGESPTGVADDAAAAEFEAAAVEGAEQLNVDDDELVNNMMDITINDDDEDDEDDDNNGESSDDEVVVQKDVNDDRIALLLKTAWANMDMMNWNNEHDEFDAAAVEGAVDYPQQEETHEEPTTAD